MTLISDVISIKSIQQAFDVGLLITEVNTDYGLTKWL